MKDDPPTLKLPNPHYVFFNFLLISVKVEGFYHRFTVLRNVISRNDDHGARVVLEGFPEKVPAPISLISPGSYLEQPYSREFRFISISDLTNGFQNTNLLQINYNTERANNCGGIKCHH